MDKPMREASITVALPYSPPLDWPFFLAYLQRRQAAGVEAVDRAGGRYSRAIRVGGAAGQLVVTHHPTLPQLEVAVYGEAGRYLDAIARHVRYMFDLDLDMADLQQSLGDDPWLGPLIRARPGIRVPRAWSAYEMLMRTIVGQQVSVPAATTIMGRLAERFGVPLDGAAEPLGAPSPLAGSVEARRHFPMPEMLAAADLANIGMPSRRIATLQRVARAIADGTLGVPHGIGAVDGTRSPWPDGHDRAAFKAALLALPGIGPWTVEYFAIRGLADPDAWPESDLVLRRAVEQHPETLARASSPGKVANRWRPWRAYAAMHLWQAVTTASEKRPSPST